VLFEALTKNESVKAVSRERAPAVREGGRRDQFNAALAEKVFRSVSCLTYMG
jgi:hypothetical protein